MSLSIEDISMKCHFKMSNYKCPINCNIEIMSYFKEKNRDGSKQTHFKDLVIYLFNYSCIQCYSLSIVTDVFTVLK